MQFYAGDIMSEPIITAKPDMTCEEARNLLLINAISGVPVVNENGVLVGVISMMDLLRSTTDNPMATRFIPDDLLEEMLGEPGFHVEQPQGFVADYMSREVLSCYPNTPIEVVANTMYREKVHRLVVLKPDEQIPVGVVSTFDLLKLMAEGYSTEAFATEPGQQARRKAKVQARNEEEAKRRGEPIAYRET